MDRTEITYLRLANQRVTSITAKTSAAEVVATLTAMQAQDYRSALWSIGLRAHGATEEQVKQSIAERKIVRTWMMRGTLHFVSSDDIRWLRMLLTPRLIVGSRGRMKQLDLDEAAISKCAIILSKALEGNAVLTRDQVYSLLEKSGISTTGQRGYHILWRLAQEGLICFATHDDKQPTFSLLDEWIPKSRLLDRDEALAELARRYFTGHGPATLQDFVWWSGLTVAEAKAGIASACPSLDQFTVDDSVYFLSPSKTPTPTDTKTVHLLPAFDEYLLGYQNRSISLDPAHASKTVPGGNGIFLPVIVIDGQVKGIWRRTIKPRTVSVSLEPFTNLTTTKLNAIESSARVFAKFLDLPVKITL